MDNPEIVVGFQVGATDFYCFSERQDSLGIE
jgi:hypothetical protein